MAAELKETFGVESEVTPAGRGVFDVFVDGNLVFSRKQENKRFPEEGEVISRIQKQNGTST